ncbi:uncharacterized protein LOC132713987 [Ruditapes philippinarum]|uniref:uncharacterized protein LOC132713987 n=1 Tax=Ruditapes philippinarum TaxID=129788 RepID=UPI00295AAEA6|nr:uncharacterized protein LOC132713987 [Ruditapes philippinarum]
MADASTSGRKVISQGTSGSNMTKDVDKQPDKLLSSSKSVASEGRKNESRGKVSTQKSQPPEKINDEVIKILQELNTNVTKQGSKLESLSKRVDDLYVEYDEYCYPDDSCNDGFLTVIASCPMSASLSDDVKFQAIQNVVVKAAINISKLLDKEGEKLDTQSIEWGTNALAFVGQSNKLINNKRKECHRSDLDPRYYPLTSASLPFTENLYGDDINKSVKDIQDISKIGRDVGRNPSFRPFGRRRSGRPGMFSRGTGRGYFRPGHGSSVVPPPKKLPCGVQEQVNQFSWSNSTETERRQRGNDTGGTSLDNTVLVSSSNAVVNRSTLCFESDYRHTYLSNTKKVHPLVGHLHLMVCRLSGNCSKVDRFHQSLPTSSWHRGDIPPKNNIHRISTNGWNSVVKGKLINFKLL